MRLVTAHLLAVPFTGSLIAQPGIHRNELKLQPDIGLFDRIGFTEIALDK